MTLARALEGQVALVTGASRGIGQQVAVDLAAAGANVVFSYRSDRAGALATVEGIERTGACAASLQVDLREPRSAAQLVDHAEQRFGRLDIVVSNAGVARDSVVWKMTDEQWSEVIDTDLTATFRLVRAAVPVMRRAGHGRIVAISSINGLRGKFGQSNYAAAKAGLIGFIRSVAREVGGYGITANVIAPGLIDTEMTTALPAEVRARAISETVVGHPGTVEDVAAAVVFLAGPGARHITGAVLSVDGGQRM
ncbi:MAG TPA: SDR family NAD(P)-dependent oxidoreductase [Candidatus Limnocylindria bacterium]|nr:SDR family NAD(P)-dependent oxidoreductase [Candidatus Limnocylindria bacterium]